MCTNLVAQQMHDVGMLLLQVFRCRVCMYFCCAELQMLRAYALCITDNHIYYSGSGQLCVHAQPCVSVQLCIQGLGDAACSSAGVLILVLLKPIYGFMSADSHAAA
jgi:hypothetical protein